MFQTQHLAETPGDQGIHGSLRLTFGDPYCWGGASAGPTYRFGSGSLGRG